MTRLTLAALVALLAGCASGGAGGNTEPMPNESSATVNRVTVRVENGTTDQMRITARGGSSLRLQAGQSGCMRLSASTPSTQLVAEPLGGGESRNVGNGGSGAIVSQAFTPNAAAAWEWKLGRGALGGNSLKPTENPC